jgi:hypothetical protein
MKYVGFNSNPSRQVRGAIPLIVFGKILPSDPLRVGKFSVSMYQADTHQLHLWLGSFETYEYIGA